MSSKTEPTWRSLVAEATARLEAAGVPTPETDARRIVEEASGWEGAEHAVHLEDRAGHLTLAAWSRMVRRRAEGEPLQYVLGRWGFRRLDLFVDRRVLIPRPETEEVVTRALAELDRINGRQVVDLGTGSGAIALSIVAERPKVEVWATDASDDALDVARANSAGLGRAARRMHLASGVWFDALPPELEGRVDLVVSNPPYVAATDALPPEVVDWEPSEALFAGPTGLEAIEAIVGDAPTWLARPGALVLEIGETQGQAAVTHARAAGFPSVDVHPDLTGRDRVLLARLP